jgi:hypothetical protein
VLICASLSKKTQNRATIIGIQGNCQMENRSVKLKEYWKIGVMGKRIGGRAPESFGMLFILLCPVIARSGSDEAICLVDIRKNEIALLRSQ